MTSPIAHLSNKFTLPSGRRQSAHRKRAIWQKFASENRWCRFELGRALLAAFPRSRPTMLARRCSPNSWIFCRRARLRGLLCATIFDDNQIGSQLNLFTFLTDSSETRCLKTPFQSGSNGIDRPDSEPGGCFLNVSLRRILMWRHLSSSSLPDGVASQTISLAQNPATPTSNFSVERRLWWSPAPQWPQSWSAPGEAERAALQPGPRGHLPLFSENS